MSWHAHMQKLNNVVDRTFAESFEFQPMAEGRSVNSRRQFDLSREPRTIQGVFDSRHAEYGSGDRAVYGFDRHHAGHGGGQTRLSFQLASFLPEERPRRGDVFKRLFTADLFEVSEIAEDGQGRFEVFVKQITTERFM